MAGPPGRQRRGGGTGQRGWQGTRLGEYGYKILNLPVRMCNS